MKRGKVRIRDCQTMKQAHRHSQGLAYSTRSRTLATLKTWGKHVQLGGSEPQFLQYRKSRVTSSITLISTLISREYHRVKKSRCVEFVSTMKKKAEKLGARYIDTALALAPWPPDYSHPPANVFSLAERIIF